MKYAEKRVCLKDGREAILRSAGAEDGDDLIRYLKVTAGETRYLLREPEEINITKEQEEVFLKRKEEAENELMLLAFVDGRHVGNCSVNALGNMKRYRHRCSVAIALYQEYCGLGLGRIMLGVILEEAKRCGYEQAELEVMADNQRAIGLYQSMGFEVYGRMPYNMKYADGSYADALWMMKRL